MNDRKNVFIFYILKGGENEEEIREKCLKNVLYKKVNSYLKGFSLLVVTVHEF